MPTVGLFNQEGKQVGDIQLNDNVFGVEVNTDQLRQELRLEEAESSLGDKKELVEQDKVLLELHNGSKVV